MHVSLAALLGLVLVLGVGVAALANASAACWARCFRRRVRSSC